MNLNRQELLTPNSIFLVSKDVVKIRGYHKWFYIEVKSVLGYCSNVVINENLFSTNGAFSLGVICLELTNQKHPFVDDKGETDIAKILRKDYPAIDIACSEGFKALPSNLMCEDRPRTD